MSFVKRIGMKFYHAYRGFQEHEDTLSAAGIAYYMAVSFFPLLLVLVAGLGWVLQWTHIGQHAQQELLTAIKQQASPNLAEQVKRSLEAVSEKASSGGPIGFVVLVISAIAIFAQLDAAFDRIFKVPSDRHEGWLSWIWRLVFQRLKALGMLVAAGGFVLLVLVATVSLSGVMKAMNSEMKLGAWVGWLTGFWVNLVLNLLAFTAIYRFVPKPAIRWWNAFWGGLVAAVLWEVGRLALAAYLLHLNYPSAYGIIGSFLAVMLWAYYGVLVILFGAEFVSALGEVTRGGETRRQGN
ncbi:MAG TPA: YihY/virulence factor BrkB family protein [Lacipirellulaceae bacterium]|nr:YihY/virulence factor BrkB family protein [Lacipirellulaceae bacterium]